ncbi:MAG TPA: hypothetical protein VMZ28_12485 [Kofleriaceae bacterium]|nr:hypothetical protein [Kofleriaceae bacterium]
MTLALVLLAACAGEMGDAPLADGGGAATADGAAATADAGTPCEPVTYRLRHLQAAMQRTDTVAQRNASIDAAFAAGADTISWTEIENLSDVQRIEGHQGWETFWPSGVPEVRAKNAVPVSFDTGVYELVRGQSWKASDGMAGVSPSRWVTRVWLRHLASGRVVSRVAHHSVSGVDGDGVAPVEWRREAHALDIAKFREVMLLDDVPVIGSADFNTVRLRSLLGDAFEYDVPASGGTHGDRLIDWVVRRPHPDHEVHAVRVLTLGYSDHRGVRVGYDYTPACD